MPQYIFLTDHHSHGHHPAFIKLFAKYLVKCGYHVIISFPADRSQWLRETLSGENVEQNFFFVDNSLSRGNVTGWGVFNDAISALRLWRATYRLIRQTEKKLNIKVDKVFFAWLDDYLANYLLHHLVDICFPFPWSGLYFHPWYLYQQNQKSKASFSSIDSVLRSRNCRSVGVHDEFVKEALSRRVGKPVILFPEIADATPPEPNYWLSEKLKQLAYGRTVVGLIGLSRRKGVKLMTQLARVADRTQFFFFFAGPIPWQEYTADEQRQLQTFFQTNFENTYHFPEFIAEGAHINAVVNAIDIMFLVYENFMSSSNFSTKAALFRKPVIATSRYWIGNATREYNMGELVDENDEHRALAALQTLRMKLLTNKFDFSKYERYLQVHREENLEESFKKSF